MLFNPDYSPLFYTEPRFVVRPTFMSYCFLICELCHIKIECKSHGTTTTGKWCPYITRFNRCISLYYIYSNPTTRSIFQDTVVDSCRMLICWNLFIFYFRRQSETNPNRDQRYQSNDAVQSILKVNVFAIARAIGFNV